MKIDGVAGEGVWDWSARLPDERRGKIEKGAARLCSKIRRDAMGCMREGIRYLGHEMMKGGEVDGAANEGGAPDPFVRPLCAS